MNRHIVSDSFQSCDHMLADGAPCYLELIRYFLIAVSFLPVKRKDLLLPLSELFLQIRINHFLIMIVPGHHLCGMIFTDGVPVCFLLLTIIRYFFPVIDQTIPGNSKKIIFMIFNGGSAA